MILANRASFSVGPNQPRLHAVIEVISITIYRSKSIRGSILIRFYLAGQAHYRAALVEALQHQMDPFLHLFEGNLV